MDPKVKDRLERGIDSLLKAGRNVKQVVDCLSPQASFGKYEGCTPAAIRSIALARLVLINAQIRTENREILAKAKASLCKELQPGGVFHHMLNRRLK